ncbi:unnamed protein product [Onchocerca flexuosa]|uniref:Uncharacterized protein n=1 Tax=Onchocerca flexuosa TaxID=387005 RepID=A0A183HKR6_9BILA|nr:unnamed protein product [Onchocerca flexuosa]
MVHKIPLQDKSMYGAYGIILGYIGMDTSIWGMGYHSRIHRHGAEDVILGHIDMVLFHIGTTVERNDMVHRVHYKAYSWDTIVRHQRTNSTAIEYTPEVTDRHTCTDRYHW